MNCTRFTLGTEEGSSSAHSCLIATIAILSLLCNLKTKQINSLKSVKVNNLLSDEFHELNDDEYMKYPSLDECQMLFYKFCVMSETQILFCVYTQNTNTLGCACDMCKLLAIV